MNRNFFFVALIVLVALTTLALSGPQIVHNNNIFLAATTNSSNSTGSTTSCTSNTTCAGKGDACTTNYDGTSNSSSSACAQGLWCINSTCATDNIGDKCTSASQCYLPSNAGAILAQCSAGICGYAYQLGDSCTNNTDCQSGLFCNTNTSLCDGLTLGSACNYTDGPWCGYGMACLPKQNGNFVCQNEVALGNSCKNFPCAPWTFCNTNNTCQAYNSVPAGGQCDSDLECVSGYNCVGMNCTAVTDSLTSCSSNSDCTGTGASCYCSEYSGKQFCVGANYVVDPCNEDIATLVTCLSSNNCSEATNAPESCSYKNCASQFKKSNTCSCSAAKTVNSSCGYNAYCGGFPIWAIIIIIVVAIVLVLGIVLLVFFMMRRRRQYESI